MTSYEFNLFSISITDKIMFLLTKEPRYREASCNAMSKLKQDGTIDEAMYREFVEDMKSG